MHWLILIANFLIIGSVQAGCPLGWTKNPDSGYCYKVLKKQGNWYSAKDNCKSEVNNDGGTGGLAKIDSAQENEFVKGLLENRKETGFWMGANDILREGSWVWEDGSPASQRCPIGWIENPETGVCYKISDDGDTLNWVAAALKCQALGSQLAILDSEEEDTFVKALLIPDEENLEGWYIGAQDIDNAFNFLWIDGTPMEDGYTNFNEGEPNNLGGIEHCAIKYSKNAIFPGNQELEWNDVPCNLELPYICQIPIPV